MRQSLRRSPGQTGEYSPPPAATTGTDGGAPAPPRADQIVSTIAAVDSPYRSNKYQASSAPSAKVSRSPTRRSGQPTPASAIVSATAEPRPPIIEWFSAVTPSRPEAAAVSTPAESSGLITGTLITETDTPDAPSAREAA